MLSKELLQPKRFLQLSITGYTQPVKPNDVPFVPIDVFRDPAPQIIKRGRGRPRKLIPIVENPVLHTEPQRMIEEYQFEEGAQLNQETGENKRGLYFKATFQIKLQVLEEYVTFRQNPPLDDQGKPFSFNHFCRSMVEQHPNLKFDTVKCWCFAYENDKSILIQL